MSVVKGRMMQEELSPREVQELVARCIEGDDAARAALYNTYRGLVRRAVARKLSWASPEEIEDISSDVFLSLYADDCETLRRLRNPKSLKSLMAAMARNQAVDHIRRNASRSRMRDALAREDQGEYHPGPDAHVVEEERRCAMARLLAEIPDLDRLVVELFYIQGLKYAEIADALGMNINTVSTRLRRAKEKLRTRIEGSSYAGNE